ncbi:hypothetical protein DB347_02545 [Opitutaceae bacterium EW11]|nr:hypothetical protein DB347_02545 [Opitutaceae bacterium EW11]
MGSGVGYCYGASPFDPDAFTLADLSNPTPNLAGFGNHADVSVSVGDAQSFDFWFSTNYGTYTLFAPENGQADPTVQGSVLWTQTPLLIPTFIPALGQQALVETWIVSISEQNGTAPASEYRIAFQQFAMQGSPLVPIPEPTTYAWCAAALCGVIVLFRRRRLQS